MCFLQNMCLRLIIDLFFHLGADLELLIHLNDLHQQKNILKFEQLHFMGKLVQYDWKKSRYKTGPRVKLFTQYIIVVFQILTDKPFSSEQTADEDTEM